MKAVMGVEATYRRVFFAAEMGVNYVTDIYTLDLAGFSDTDYLAKYHDLIPGRALRRLRDHAQLMAFYASNQGPFAYLLYFLPAYHNFATQEQFAAYFTPWHKAAELKSPVPFQQYLVSPPVFGHIPEIA